MTKWQAFAATKGIASKPRRDRLVFDEDTQDWVPKWGYKGKNKQLEDQWIVEVPKNAGSSPLASFADRLPGRSAIYQPVTDTSLSARLFQTRPLTP